MNHDLILVIDDEVSIRSSLQGILEDEGFRVRTTATGEQGLDMLAKGNFSLVLLDIWLPEMSGLDVLTEIQRLEEKPAVVVISGHGTVETAVKAVKLGAYDFLEKPLSLDKVVLTVRNALRRFRLEEENIQLRERLRTRDHLIGASAVMKRLRAEIKTVAPTNGRILLTGENGTGKEFVARSIHGLSRRREKRFVELNCAAIPEALIDAELFGHVKGAGPNPAKDKKGKLLQADGGTLFLDEIGALPGPTQASLLHALTTGSFEPVGGSEPVAFDARIVAATSRGLFDLVRQGRFLEDLYYKLNIIPMALPPLRERAEDIPLLISYFLRVYCLDYGKKPKSMHPDAVRTFVRYPWPGNVSELMNVLERFVILVEGLEIGPTQMNLFVEAREQGSGTLPPVPLNEALRSFERETIARALQGSEWDEERAASVLGLPAEILRTRIRDLRITLLD